LRWVALSQWTVVWDVYVTHSSQNLLARFVRPPTTAPTMRNLQGTQAQAQAVVHGAAQLMGAEPAVSLDDVFTTTAGESLLPAAPPHC